MNDRNTMILCALLIATSACSGTDRTLPGADLTDLTSSAYSSAATATVNVDPAATILAVGSTITLRTNLYDSTGRRTSGTMVAFAHWVSSDTTIATVASTGLVRGLRNGVVTINLVAGSTTGASTVTVGTGSSASPTAATPAAATPILPSVPPNVTSQQPSAFQGAVVSDDFTKYATTADLLANISLAAGGTGDAHTCLYNDGGNAALVELDKAVLYHGHATMKYNQPAGGGATPQIFAFFPGGRTLTHLWFRAKIRFSPGWTTTGTLTNSANSYKLLNWNWAGANGRGGVTITNTTQYQMYFNVIVNNSLVTPENDLAAGQVTNEWTSGDWYDYIIEYQQTSPTTAVGRVWITQDGQTPVLRTTIQGTTNGPAITWPTINAVNLGENFNQIRVNAQQVWWGEWSAYDGNSYPNPYNLH